jgi:hypothetical protein
MGDSPQQVPTSQASLGQTSSFSGSLAPWAKLLSQFQYGQSQPQQPSQQLSQQFQSGQSQPQQQISPQAQAFLNPPAQQQAPQSQISNFFRFGGGMAA